MTLGIDVKKLDKAGLDNLIVNCEAKGATKGEVYQAAVAERAERFGKGLKAEATIQLLVECAKRRVFTTYGNVAAASSVPWTAARRQMDGAHGHLDHVLALCHARGWPLLTALVVDQRAQATGRLQGAALDGFIGRSPKAALPGN